MRRFFQRRPARILAPLHTDEAFPPLASLSFFFFLNSEPPKTWPRLFPRAGTHPSRIHCLVSPLLFRTRPDGPFPPVLPPLCSCVHVVLSLPSPSFLNKTFSDGKNWPTPSGRTFCAWYLGNSQIITHRAWQGRSRPFYLFRDGRLSPSRRGRRHV